MKTKLILILLLFWSAISVAQFSYSMTTYRDRVGNKTGTSIGFTFSDGKYTMTSYRDNVGNLTGSSVTIHSKFYSSTTYNWKVKKKKKKKSKTKETEEKIVVKPKSSIIKPK